MARPYHTGHLADEEIARLIDGAGKRLGDEEAWQHIRHCRRCFEVLRDSAIYRGLWEAGGEEFGADEKLVALGDDLASRGTSSGSGWIGLDPAAYRRIRKPLRFVAIAAALSVAAIAIWIGFGARRPGVVRNALDLALVRGAVQEASLRGSFLFPGTEDLSVPPGAPVYRSAYVSVTDSLDDALSRLFDLCQAGKCSKEDVFWLIAGCAAVGKIDLARDIVLDARRRSLSDHRVDVLEAMIASYSGDNGRAEKLLRAMVDAAPRDPVARVNLAVVLMSQGKESEAKAMIEDIAVAPRGTVLGDKLNALRNRHEDKETPERRPKGS